MNRATYRAQQREQRIAERHAENCLERKIERWRVWAQGMTLLRTIHAECKDQFRAIALAQQRLDDVKRVA